MSFLSTVISALGIDKVLPILEQSVGVNVLVPLVEQAVVAEAKAAGHDGVQRAFTMPDSAVHAICAKTGADYNTQIALRDVAAKAEADFIMGFYPSPPAPAALAVDP